MSAKAKLATLDGGNSPFLAPDDAQGAQLAVVVARRQLEQQLYRLDLALRSSAT